MRSKVAMMIGLLVLSSSIGCVGPRVEIETAQVGKVLTSSGFQKGLKQPSTFRLPVNFLGLNPTSLVVAEAPDRQKKESMSLFMPKDRLIMSFDVRGTYRISNDEEQVNRIFSRLVSTPYKDYVLRISFDDVYQTYGQQIVVTTSRSVLSKYTIDEVVNNRETINAELEREISLRLKNTPLAVVHFGLSTVQPPELIVDAKEKAKEAEVAIKQAREDRLVKLTEASARLEVARKEQLVDLLEADTSRQVGLALTKGVNLQFAQQRVLAILERLSRSNDQVVIVPKEALQNEAMMIAVNQKAFEDLPPEGRVAVSQAARSEQ